MTQRTVVAIAYVAIGFLTILDTTIVNTALPSIGADFGVGGTEAGGVVVAYLVASGVFMPASGWLGDRFGTKGIFLGGLALFTAASLVCAIAGSLTTLTVARAGQGAGAGLLLPVGLTMLFRVYPPDERVRIGRVLMAPTVIAPAIGPLLGGLLVETLSWRWAFWLNIPLGLAALGFGLLWMKDQRGDQVGRFDLRGFALAAIGFGFVLYAVSEGPREGWGSTRIVVFGLLGISALTALVLLELRIDKPMLELRLLGQRRFAASCGAIVAANASFMAVLYLVPVFLQEARGATALASGLATFPEALGVICFTELVGRLYPRFGPRALMAFGFVAVAFFTALLALIDLDTATPLIMGLMFLIGGAMAFEFLPSQTSAFADLDGAETGAASTIFNVGSRLGSALGVAVVSSTAVAVGTTDSSGLPDLSGYQVAFGVAAALGAVGLVAAALHPSRHSEQRAV